MYLGLKMSQKKPHSSDDKSDLATEWTTARDTVGKLDQGTYLGWYFTLRTIQTF
jgi:hypothetical protein